MFRFLPIGFTMAGLGMLLTGGPLAVAQSSRQLEKKQQEMQRAMQEKLRRIAESQPELPTDPQLLSLQKDFVTKTEKLAMEYERKKDFDKARDAYESIVRLVPKYARAEEGLARVLGSQSSQDRKLCTVLANQDWQDSGATLLEGMPVRIEVQGRWTVAIQSGPAGIEIPKEQRPDDSRIRFGTLVGAVVTNPSELAEAKLMRIDGKKEF